MHQAVPAGQSHIVQDTAGDVAPASAEGRRAQPPDRRGHRGRNLRDRRQRPARPLRHLRQLPGVPPLRRRRPRRSGPTRGRSGSRADAHVHRRRRGPGPATRPCRRARAEQAHRPDRVRAPQLGDHAARPGREGARRVRRGRRARRDGDPRRSARHQPLVADQRAAEEPAGRALGEGPPMGRGRVGHHDGRRQLRCPRRTAPRRRARRTG